MQKTNIWINIQNTISPISNIHTDKNIWICNSQKNTKANNHMVRYPTSPLIRKTQIKTGLSVLFQTRKYLVWQKVWGSRYSYILHVKRYTGILLDNIYQVLKAHTFNIAIHFLVSIMSRNMDIYTKKRNINMDFTIATIKIICKISYWRSFRWWLNKLWHNHTI